MSTINGIFTTARSAKQKGRGQHVLIRSEEEWWGCLEFRAVIGRHGTVYLHVNLYVYINCVCPVYKIYSG